MPGDRKHGLGKGMGSLLSGFDYDAQMENIVLNEDEREEAPLTPPPSPVMTEKADDTGERVIYINLSAITPNPNQPRKTFDDDSLNELAESIKSQGVIQPIIVEEYAPGKYSIIAGERRFRAAQIAGLNTIPSIIKSFGEIQRMEVSLIENVQRENLNPIEEAFAYQYLIQKSGYTQEEVARKVGKSRSAVTNSIRLLNLPDTIKDDLISGLADRENHALDRRSGSAHHQIRRRRSKGVRGQLLRLPDHGDGMAQVVQRLHRIYIQGHALFSQKLDQLRVSASSLMSRHVKRHHSFFLKCFQRLVDRGSLLSLSIHSSTSHQLRKRPAECFYPAGSEIFTK